MSPRKALWLNIIRYTIGGVLILILSYFFGNEYIRHYQEYSQTIENRSQLDESLTNFSLSQIENISDVSLITTPNLMFLDDLVGFIDTAEKEIFIEVYLLTEKRIPKALIQAHNRGVTIKIIVEKNPYKAYNINNKNYTLLKEAGIDIIWSHPENYSLNHSKLILIDGLVILSTGNLSYSTFSKNRDFFVIIDTPDIYEIFKKIFLADFTGTSVVPYHPNILLSPDSSRTKIETLIQSANTSIMIYMQYLLDEDIEKHILEKANEGIHISAVMPESYFEQDRNTQQILRLESAGIMLHELTSDSMHAKAILVDDIFLYIGSINMSSYSLDHNREMGIFVKDTHIIQSFLQQYTQDIKIALQKQR